MDTIKGVKSDYDEMQSAYDDAKSSAYDDAKSAVGDLKEKAQETKESILGDGKLAKAPLAVGYGLNAIMNSDFDDISFDKIKDKANGIKDSIFNTGKFEKAYFVELDNDYKEIKERKKLQVQFNPSELRIHRSLHTSEKKSFGKESKVPEAVHGKNSVLSFSLYFDSYTKAIEKPGLKDFLTDQVKGIVKPDWFPSFDMNEETAPDDDPEVHELLKKVLSLIRYTKEDHKPPNIGFVWGEHFNFVGKVTDYTVNFTAFGKDGAPIRAKIDLTMQGEEKVLLGEELANPFESPDRTKQRTLLYGDQLWMMAQDEYGDVSRWKTIAAANNILNPRTISEVVHLKVPSIR